MIGVQLIPRRRHRVKVVLCPASTYSIVRQAHWLRDESSCLFRQGARLVLANDAVSACAMKAFGSVAECQASGVIRCWSTGDCASMRLQLCDM